MSKRKQVRGGALLEFAMALPFALTLFIGIGDFTVFFWRQIQIEEVTRSMIAGLPPDLVAADPASISKFAESVQTEIRKTSGHSQFTVSIAKGYSCPLPSGAELDWTGEPRNCQAERTYLKLANDDPVEPLFRPLRHMGFPKTAFSRHVIRIR